MGAHRVVQLRPALADGQTPPGRAVERADAPQLVTREAA
jgi:hypothetical protein